MSIRGTRARKRRQRLAAVGIAQLGEAPSPRGRARSSQVTGSGNSPVSRFFTSGVRMRSGRVDEIAKAPSVPSRTSPGSNGSGARRRIHDGAVLHHEVQLTAHAAMRACGAHAPGLHERYAARRFSVSAVGARLRAGAATRSRWRASSRRTALHPRRASPHAANSCARRRCEAPTQR